MAVSGHRGDHAGLLSLLHACEARGAIELSALANITDDPPTRLLLTGLAAEDARHAHALLGRMEALDVPCLRVPSKLDPLDAVLSRCRTRDVKQVYQERSLLSEAALMEVTVAVIVGKAQFVQTLRTSRESFFSSGARHRSRWRSSSPWRSSRC